jgi:carbamoyl-phosphate synthase small subunit
MLKFSPNIFEFTLTNIEMVKLMAEIRANLILQNGMIFEGVSFGAEISSAGEVIFNTSMVGYPESLTDPSYYGQILVTTYPLIGNYGVPANDYSIAANHYESDRIQVKGLIVSEYSIKYSHWQAAQSLAQWLKAANVAALSGIDTRKLTQVLREEGSMLGKIVFDKEIEFYDPNRENVVIHVSPKTVTRLGNGSKRIALLDLGCKLSIIRYLLQWGAEVIRLPYDSDLSQYDFDGLVISNGPGNPKQCPATIEMVKYAIANDIPTFGICLGNQLIALAAGADTYKLKYGHHSQNQPVTEVGTDSCLITAQNHGFAVNEDTLPDGWSPWFRNLNDNTNEGIIHHSGRFMSTQFHPEAAPGPNDALILFEKFMKLV